VSGVPTPVVHPSLARAFQTLSHASVRWCVLRGWESLDQPGDDVDLLVAAADLPRAAAALEKIGYLRLPSWGRGSHRFFLTYDASTDAWIKLDLVSELAFGAGGIHSSGTEDALLSRAVAEGSVRHAHPDDAFWALLLHCLLDRGAVEPHHAVALANLAPSATADAPLARWLRARVPESPAAVAIIRAATQGDLGALESLGRTVGEALSTPGSKARSARRWAARRLTKARRALLERGLTVALLGIDGAGKSTIAARLRHRLPWPVRSVYLGLYGSGARGRAPRGLPGRLARLWAGYVRATGHRLRGRFVIYDRFGWDVLLGPEPHGRRRAARRWLLANAIPAPDLAVLLDVPPEIAHARKGEHDIGELRRRRDAYLALARRRPEIIVIRADRDYDLILRDISAALWDRVLARRGKRHT
jgi:thymidylate kinase